MHVVFSLISVIQLRRVPVLLSQHEALLSGRFMSLHGSGRSNLEEFPRTGYILNGDILLCL